VCINIRAILFEKRRQVHQESVNIWPEEQPIIMTVLNRDNRDSISMFLSEIESAVLVFWRAHTIRFIGPSGTEIGGVLIDLKFVQTPSVFRK
jgi:hypothetical protein